MCVKPCIFVLFLRQKWENTWFLTVFGGRAAQNPVFFTLFGGLEALVVCIPNSSERFSNVEKEGGKGQGAWLGGWAVKKGKNTGFWPSWPSQRPKNIVFLALLRAGGARSPCFGQCFPAKGEKHEVFCILSSADGQKPVFLTVFPGKW